MNYIKLYEAYFSNSKTYELINNVQYSSFIETHNTINYYSYDKELNIINSIYNLSKKGKMFSGYDEYDIKTMPWQGTNDDFVCQELVIYLKPNPRRTTYRIVVHIEAFEDEWYIIKYCDYLNIISTYSRKFYVVDGLDGINDIIKDGLLDGVLTL